MISEEEQAAHPMPGAWHWWASYDSGDIFSIGPFDSRDEVFQAVIEDRCGEYKTKDGDWRISALIAECKFGNVDLALYFDEDRFLEDAWERMDDNNQGSNEDGDCHPLEGLSTECKRDLEASVRSAIRSWQKRHELPLKSYYFASTRNEENIDVPHPDE
ncbi:hypothetical protein [uncultured Roseibium sp.]|uniref:hypothetical protein n=1 Tax=uncultured Roseibium sp. TaxID=1936171 RepID=UPI002626DBF9|nr:hypothetical protein [uncultured Roseibium sp.]